MYKYDLASLMNNVMESKEHKHLFEKKAFEIVEAKTPLKEVASLLVKASTMLDELDLNESSAKIANLASILIKNSDEKKVREMLEETKTLDEPNKFNVETLVNKHKEKEELNKLFDKLMFLKEELKSIKEQSGEKLDSGYLGEKFKLEEQVKVEHEIDSIKNKIIELLDYVDMMEMTPSDKDVDELSEEDLDSEESEDIFSDEEYKTDFED